ncbi:hypothetical protein ACE102_47685 (plasmid) [Bradyrhizobium sp. vgs-9]|uniref:Uncharacterized protein n=1 Tax=Bradyrhizobium barranii subsp. barranii TaxID=2823807 RepID=A0A7Z0TTX3_9BRAD|nr:hypothetical protein [Bradyrhizobium barranii]UGX99623.1 hypothetical protein G6321_00054060 [Bradyrhizobium barranii subsp. barranii]
MSTVIASGTGSGDDCELVSFVGPRVAPSPNGSKSSEIDGLAGGSLLSASSKGYYVCLVRQLSGAQSNEAAAAIMSACRAPNPL